MNTTKGTTNVCICMFYSLMYGRVQYNTANNNKNNYCILPQHPIFGLGQANEPCQHHRIYWPWPGSGGKISLHAGSNPGTHQLKYLGRLLPWLGGGEHACKARDHILSTAMRKTPLSGLERESIQAERCSKTFSIFSSSPYSLSTSYGCAGCAFLKMALWFWNFSSKAWL